MAKDGRRLRFAMVLMSAVVVGCGSSAGPGDGGSGMEMTRPPCEPAGLWFTCTCVDGKVGMSVCTEDLRWGPCVCERDVPEPVWTTGTDTSATTDGSGDGSTSGTSLGGDSAAASTTAASTTRGADTDTDTDTDVESSG